jgi:hypothetical protein
VSEEWEVIRALVEQGVFAVEWTRGRPEVQFWPGERFSHMVSRVSLRDLLQRELQVAVPREFFGNPMNFAAPEEWMYAEEVRLLQALLRAYDKWEKKARR